MLVFRYMCTCKCLRSSSYLVNLREHVITLHVFSLMIRTLRVYIHNVSVCTGKTPTSFIHVDVLPAHTGGVSNVNTAAYPTTHSPNTHHDHHHQQPQHTTTHSNTQQHTTPHRNTQQHTSPRQHYTQQHTTPHNTTHTHNTTQKTTPCLRT